MADAVLVRPEDLSVFKPDLNPDAVEAQIRFATARAFRIAPCLRTASGDTLEEARGTIVRAILRSFDEGTGALQQWTDVNGPFSRSATVDTRGGTSHGIFYPSEESTLRSLCTATTRRAKSGWLL